MFQMSAVASRIYKRMLYVSYIDITHTCITIVINSLENINIKNKLFGRFSPGHLHFITIS